MKTLKIIKKKNNNNKEYRYCKHGDYKFGYNIQSLTKKLGSLVIFNFSCF